MLIFSFFTHHMFHCSWHLLIELVSQQQVYCVLVVFSWVVFLFLGKKGTFYLAFPWSYRVLACSDLEVSSILESSLNVKEKIISELNMELHNMETTLSNEREQHLNEIKKLNALLNEKVIVLYFCLDFLSL